MTDYVATLNVAELTIRRALSLADATPFLAHCELREADKSRFADGVRRFLAGDGSRIPEALRRWPLTSVWNFAIALSEDYGEDSHAVYAVLERTLGVEIAGDVRGRTIAAFRAVCRKYGLCYEGSGRWVNDYLAQAGIATSQLDHVAKAFVFAERAFGPPSNDNTAAINSWEDDATHFLPQGVRIPRMVLEVDETAHYAFLFTRYRQQEAPRNQFEKLFFDEIAKAQSAITGGRRAEAVPRPSLIWGQNGLALALPKFEGRMSISIAGEPRRLRGGQSWPLSTPWPTSVDWSLDDHSERISVFPTSHHLLAFESESGRLVGQIDTAQQPQSSVDAREIVLVASRPFSLDGDPAFEVGRGGYASHCVLGAAATTLKMDSRTLNLTAKPKPRIWIESGSVAKGPKGLLVLSDTTFGIEVGGLDTEEFDLALSIGDREDIIPLLVSLEERAASYQLADQSGRAVDLVPVKAELRLRGSNRALVRYKAWLWPGLRSLKDGLVFDSDTVPGNYAADRSRHVSVDDSGRLCLDTEAAYETATLAFLVGHERVDFDIPRPGVSLTFTDVEGRSVPLRIGETLIVRDEDKGGSLSVRCPERFASLTVRGRSELEAFVRTPTRVLSLADLAAPAPRDDITLAMPGASYAPITLARIVPAVAPKQFLVERRGDNLTLRIEMQTDVDAIRFSLEDETGNRTDHDCALGHREVEGRRPEWLDANLDMENSRRILATANLREFRGELSLASILVRAAGTDSFRPLRNMRGDSFAIVLKPIGERDTAELVEASDTQKRFVTLNRWMSECFAQESWDHVGPRIQPRWMTLGGALSTQSGGLELLLSCGHLPPQPGAARSWVPLAHPLQISTSLYGAPAKSFFVLSSDASEGSEHLAFLAEIAGKTIQEVHRTVGLSPAFLMAFDNFHLARQSFDKFRHAHQPALSLRGFNFDKYRQVFQAMDTNPGARWFWRLGDELLGPAHYGAAVGRLIDRLYDAGLEEDGSNDARIRAATALAHAAFRLKEKTLPVPTGIEESHAVLEWAPAFFSGFARASRAGSADAYLKGIGATIDRPHRALIGDASFLVRLAPELFAFYLTLWELCSERQAA